MSNEFSMGFVALFGQPLERPQVCSIVAHWLERFERVEQVAPQGVLTMILSEPGDLNLEPNLQFRITNSDQFAWVYLTCGRRIIETTGMPNGEEVSLCLSVLTELPGLERIYSDKDDKKLGELEKEGLL